MKTSIRFYNDYEVRAIWDEEKNQWFFSVLDIVGALNGQDDYEKNRNYWKYLKSKLKKENSQLVSVTTQLKILAPDGKRRLSDVLNMEGVFALAKVFPNNKVNAFNMVQFANSVNEFLTFFDKQVRKMLDNG